MSLALQQNVDDNAQMRLRETLKTELHKAETENLEQRAATLRLVLCAVRDRDIKARQKDECSVCEETEINAILRHMIAQREAAAEEYDAAGKIELAEQEREEVETLKEFLPQCLGKTEITLAAEEVVNELGAECLKDMGRCVSELKARYPDRIESGAAKSAVKKLLL
ncbi:GatB/YqeY domain-containing protein [Hirschia baltica]|uniref:Putative cytoplasmic protein n=1 Tax=Hirschia baltica (strain ATCC 49814 / DSM 5838 / IFAM 1418) TaxID=582402 RepID=C6XRH8_HIRBI|nr:GatB/YqeY domain-containing protein [Hirschia baltica]ACT58810.1 putative cytoplasmic protein [Hirschia baltica ATCC 49814]